MGSGSSPLASSGIPFRRSAWYLEPVCRSVPSRLAALLVALTASFAAPVSSLAHGLSHHHEATWHAADDHRHPSDSHVVDAQLEFGVESINNSLGDHPHATVSAAMVAKHAAPLVALIALPVMLPPIAVVVTPPPEADVKLEPRASPAHAPPPRLRGPPIVLG